MKRTTVLAALIAAALVGIVLTALQLTAPRAADAEPPAAGQGASSTSGATAGRLVREDSHRLDEAHVEVPALDRHFAVANAIHRAGVEGDGREARRCPDALLRARETHVHIPLVDEERATGHRSHRVHHDESAVLVRDAADVFERLQNARFPS